MPKTTITYRIFVASPSDITEEKNIIREVADELNKSNHIRNIKLEVIDWGSSTYPAIGDDAQDVINNQINDEYDIFIGIFWHKFGTATKRDVSGTKEEFERAYSRFVADSNSVHIMIYFKEEPVSPSSIDPDQIRHIQKFKEEISNRGVLYRNFNRSDEFDKLLRPNLSLLLNGISVKVEEEVNNPSTENKLIILEKSENNEDELGYLEYLELATKEMGQVTTELGKITKQTLDLGGRMTKKTEKINLLNKLPPQIIIKESRKIIDGSAGDLDIYSKKVGPIIPVMNELFNKSMSNFNKAILIHKKFLNEQGLSTALEHLTFLRNSISSAHDELLVLRSMIKSFPPLTNKLLKSKKDAVDVMSKIAEEFQSYVNITDNIVNIIVTE